jgi:hypothetical protein
VVNTPTEKCLSHINEDVFVKIVIFAKQEGNLK